MPEGFSRKICRAGFAGGAHDRSRSQRQWFAAYGDADGGRRFAASRANNGRDTRSADNGRDACSVDNGRDARSADNGRDARNADNGRDAAGNSRSFECHAARRTGRNARTVATIREPLHKVADGAGEAQA
jgi:hypothetical protein